MKNQIKKIARRMAAWPIIGRGVKVAAALNRLPRMSHSFNIFEASKLPEIEQKLERVELVLAKLKVPSELMESSRQIFETQQLPTMLQTISELNNRQLMMNNDTENIVKSVPVALRNFARRMGNNEGEKKQIAESIGYLMGRIEFVRRELMYEMRYGATEISEQTESVRSKSEVVSLEKLAEAKKSDLKVNLGCGHIPIQGYLNIDRRKLPGVDIVAEVDELPFNSGEIDEIYSSHLLEHFPQEQLKRVLLPYYCRLLKVGGEFRAVVPDAQAMINEYQKGELPYNDFREVLFGGQDYDGDFHFNMFTPASLSELLVEAGFEDVRIIDSNRRNGKCYEFEISAAKKAGE
jgi:predicted SAM-dependent methyltransferase